MKELFSKLNIKWQELRYIQRSKFISSMYIWIFFVPVVAKLLFKIEEHLSFCLFGQKIELVFSLPFSWKVFFYSALSFSIANSIVLVACPKIIKDHLSFAGYIGDGKTHEHLKEYAEDIADTYFPLLNDRPSVDERDRIMHSEHVRDEFWRIYNKGNLTQSVLRITTLLFYVVGTALFLWVLGMNIYWVTKYVL
ncbi:MAG: hypothetical protein ACFFFH_18590 [Candidatus Thorarchaeota archaeon]